MIRVTIEKITEYDETANTHRDPETGRLYDSKYQVTGANDEKLSDAEIQAIWDRCVPYRRPTGKKLQETKQAYVQTIDPGENDEKERIENIIKAANDITD